MSELPKQYQSFTYATEVDVLNAAMFGKTAKQWRDDRLLELNLVAKEQMRSFPNSAGVKRLGNTK